MERYGRWSREGYLSSNGRCFDIGGTVSGALRTYALMGNPFAGSRDEFSAGNGSIMRLGAVPMFYQDWEDAIHYSAESSRTTHGAEACLGACRLFGSMLHKALAGCSKEDILFGDHFPAGTESALPETIEAIAVGSYRTKDRDAILLAANLGNDADTTAAVCGQIAGAYYGLSGIPEAWLQRIAKRYLIESLIDELIARRTV